MAAPGALIKKAKAGAEYEGGVAATGRHHHRKRKFVLKDQQRLRGGQHLSFHPKSKISVAMPQCNVI